MYIIFVLYFDSMFSCSHFALVLTVLQIIRVSSQANLVCDGNFEKTVLNSVGFSNYQILTTPKFEYVNNNSSCWYSVGRSNFEVKQFLISGHITQVADFISDRPYTICQDITLKINTTYQLSFLFIIDGPHISSTLNCKLNLVKIYSIVSNNKDKPVIANV